VHRLCLKHHSPENHYHYSFNRIIKYNIIIIKGKFVNQHMKNQRRELEPLKPKSMKFWRQIFNPTCPARKISVTSLCFLSLLLIFSHFPQFSQENHFSLSQTQKFPHFISLPLFFFLSFFILFIYLSLSLSLKQQPKTTLFSYSLFFFTYSLASFFFHSSNCSDSLSKINLFNNPLSFSY
jgi:hypothetical protein